MAPKRSTPIENPPAASSSEEEEDEEETSSGEEQETQKPQKTQESDSESGSESESDDDDDKKRKDLPNSSTVKPIASKPMEEPPKNTKSRSKKSSSSTATPAKRGTTEVDPKDSKRAKKNDAEKSVDAKKQLFQRLWSEDDEIVVLKGITDFMEKKGVDPSKDMASFYDYIKKSLHFDVSLPQLKHKIGRLKKKFKNHVKGKQGEDKTFSKAHDQKSFDLSKKIWGVDGSIGGLDLNNVKSNGKANKKTGSSDGGGGSESLAGLKAELGDKEKKTVVKIDGGSGLKQFDFSVDVEGMEDYVVKRGLDMVDEAKRAEMEEKWKKLHVAQLELFVKRNELITEQAKLMLVSYKAQ